MLNLFNLATSAQLNVGANDAALSALSENSSAIERSIIITLMLYVIKDSKRWQHNEGQFLELLTNMFGGKEEYYELEHSISTNFASALTLKHLSTTQTAELDGYNIPPSHAHIKQLMAQIITCKQYGPLSHLPELHTAEQYTMELINTTQQDVMVRERETYLVIGNLLKAVLAKLTKISPDKRTLFTHLKRIGVKIPKKYGLSISFSFQAIVWVCITLVTTSAIFAIHVAQLPLTAGQIAVNPTRLYEAWVTFWSINIAIGMTVGFLTAKIYFKIHRTVDTLPMLLIAGAAVIAILFFAVTQLIGHQASYLVFPNHINAFHVTVPLLYFVTTVVSLSYGASHFHSHDKLAWIVSRRSINWLLMTLISIACALFVLFMTSLSSKHEPLYYQQSLSIYFAITLILTNLVFFYRGYRAAIRYKNQIQRADERLSLFGHPLDVSVTVGGETYTGKLLNFSSSGCCVDIAIHVEDKSDVQLQLAESDLTSKLIWQKRKGVFHPHYKSGLNHENEKKHEAFLNWLNEKGLDKFIVSI
ncbi:PilZ domain-containing protein [Aestuariibacter sp. AA17]|uniref:PilZ domain-containing protein n=1 Tax=Fluctibacter corallii TaxID=2984329 RepID=A0ABT3AA22_9ALTE|nr:PilZ domain-containing protein [Aestuariibacter sp. AA17]MCV2885525.1 PilZ domain-containing protein [Aestuariibacter sp. AA17]